MLQFLRSKASSVVVKALFVVLIFSFGVWGVGDIFRNRGSDTTIASVGDNSLSPDQLRSMVDRYFKSYQQLQRAGIADNPQVRTAVAHNSINEWITEKLYIEEAKSLGLAVSDDILKRRIAEDASFQDEKTKKFSAEKFRSILQSNGLTEAQYLTILRRQIITNQFAFALADTIYVPKPLQTAMFKFDNETRDGTILEIPYSDYNKFAKLVGKDKLGQPTNADLEQFIAEYKDEFSTPEYRKLTVLVLSPEGAAKDVKIGEDELKQAYESHKAEYETPETRTLKQAVFKSKEQAEKAYELATNGKQSLANAADQAGKVPEINLGTLKQSDLPAELSKPVFTAKSGEVTKPIETGLGWHIVKIEKITPGKIKSFAEVKAELQSRLALEKSSESLYKLSDQLQDELAGGASFESIAKKIPSQIVALPPITRGVLDANGKVVTLPVPKSKDALVTVAFSTEAGKTGGLTEAAEGGFFVVRVDEITPARLKSLNEVREKASKHWQAQDTQKTGQEIYTKLAEQIRSGKTISDIAGNYGLKTKSLTGMNRTGESGGEAAKNLFAVDKGQLARIPNKTGLTVGTVTAIHPATKPMEGQIGIVSMLKKEISQDISDQLQSALRDRFDVHVNERAIETLY